MVVQSAFERNYLMVAVPTELSILTTSLCILFTITNIPGNFLIILAVVFNPNKNLRIPFNWLVVNLVTADLIVGMATEVIVWYIDYFFSEFRNINSLRAVILSVLGLLNNAACSLVPND